MSQLKKTFFLFSFFFILIQPSFAQQPTQSAPSEPKESIQQMYDEVQRISIEMQDTYQKLKNPQVKRLIHLLTDKTFTEPLKQKIEAFDIRMFLLVNLGVLLILAGVKAWWIAGKRKWFQRFLANISFNGIYLITFLVAIPYYFLGQPYFRIIQEFVGILFTSN